MNKYLVLLRGINVGGKNKILMSELRECLEKEGFSNVATFIASGNVILESEKNVKQLRTQIEKALPKYFKLDSELIKVLVLSRKQLQSIVNKKPKGFGDESKKFHSDVVFLIDIDSIQALTIFSPKEGVDKIWKGDGVIYSQRLSALRTKSRLSKIIASPLYKSMTIRTWSTVIKLLDLLNKS